MIVAMMLDTGGMELHYDTHGDGEPLLWLHGGMGIGADWQHIFKEAPREYRLIAPDLRGHGRSTGAQATYSFKQSALDVFALLDHLQIDRVKAIGLSGGGITALHMATLQPSRITAMVVVSAPARFPEQARAIQRAFSEATMSEGDRHCGTSDRGRINPLRRSATIGWIQPGLGLPHCRVEAWRGGKVGAKMRG